MKQLALCALCALPVLAANAKPQAKPAPAQQEISCPPNMTPAFDPDQKKMICIFKAAPAQQAADPYAKGQPLIEKIDLNREQQEADVQSLDQQQNKADQISKQQQLIQQQQNNQFLDDFYAEHRKYQAAREAVQTQRERSGWLMQVGLGCSAWDGDPYPDLQLEAGYVFDKTLPLSFFRQFGVFGSLNIFFYEPGDVAFSSLRFAGKLIGHSGVFQLSMGPSIEFYLADLDYDHRFSSGFRWEFDADFYVSKDSYLGLNINLGKAQGEQCWSGTYCEDWNPIVFETTFHYGYKF